MGILNDMKKLLFGAKSVAKSGANKVVEKGKEVGGDLKGKGEKVWKDAKDKAADLGEEVKERSSTPDSALVGSGYQWSANNLCCKPLPFRASVYCRLTC